jgi:hypothetical protein
MRNQQNDRQQLNDLMNGWMHRDLGEWEQLNELFHPDGTIEITWFEGLGSDFVKGSMRMGTSDLRTKHLIASPAVTFNANGDKAILETNAIIIAENVKLNIGCECHNRFYDLAEKEKVSGSCSAVRVFMTWVRLPSRWARLKLIGVLPKSTPGICSTGVFTGTERIPTRARICHQGQRTGNKMKADAQRWLSA